MASDQFSIVRHALPGVLLGLAYGYYKYTQNVVIQPSQIFSLSPPSGSTFSVQVRLLDNSIVPVAGCFSEMKVGELMKRTAVALQTPPGRVQLQLQGLPVSRDLTIGGAGITPTTLLDFRTSLLGGMRSDEEAILKSYTQLLNGESVTVARSQICAWQNSLTSSSLKVVNDYFQQTQELLTRTWTWL